MISSNSLSVPGQWPTGDSQHFLSILIWRKASTYNRYGVKILNTTPESGCLATVSPLVWTEPNAIYSVQVIQMRKDSLILTAMHDHYLYCQNYYLLTWPISSKPKFTQEKLIQVKLRYPPVHGFIVLSQCSFTQKQAQVINIKNHQGLPWWLRGEESACQCRTHRFDPSSGRIPHATEHLSLCTATTESML